VVKEGEEASAAVAEAGRRTTSRRELARHDRFSEVSPEVGELDPDAFDELYDDDPDAALALLADLTGATDERLRSLARTLAGRVITELARTGRITSRGIGRLVARRGGEGDLDLDASLDAIVEARAAGTGPDVSQLVTRDWTRPGTAVCLLVDRSGSMTGERLAAAAVAAAAVVVRHGADCSVVAFGTEAVVVRSQGDARDAEAVMTDLFRLRGHGTTDVAMALRTARAQLDRSRAGRRITVLLSDCRPTAGGPATAEASALDELVIIAPADDTEDAAALAGEVGCRWIPLGGPTTVPDALHRALHRD